MKARIFKWSLLGITAIILTLFMPVPSSAQSLFPFPLASNPPDDPITPRPLQKGRRGLVYRYQFLNAMNQPDQSGFPLDVSGASADVQIGAAAPIPCTAGINPSPNQCSFMGLHDAVKIFFNGDFPSGETIKYGATGVKSSVATNSIAQTGSDKVTFKVGGVAPTTASLEMVLDISGSMGLLAVPPSGTQTRIQALKNSAQAFFNMLSAHAILGDKIGAVYFSTTATAFSQPPGGTNLKPAHDSTQVNLIAADVQGQTPTFATSIGAGLKIARTSGFDADPAPGANVKKSVVLFSDGEQNTAPLVQVVGANVQVSDDQGANYANYPADITVCPITLGPQTAPGFALQQSIADAKCGGKNAHVQPGQDSLTVPEMETFFSQLLTDVLIGDKLELVKDVKGSVTQGTNVKEQFLGNTDDVALSILLSLSAVRRPDEGNLFLPLRLRAPDGTVIDLSNRVTFGRDMTFTTIGFPLNQGGTNISSKGEWEIELLGSEANVPDVNYHLVVILDNAHIASDFRIETQDVGTGEPIPIRVQLMEGGVPIKGATVVAQVEGPENGLGDLLAKTAAPQGTPNPGGQDKVRSEGQKKLLLLLNDPAFADLLKNKSLPTVTLLDNGQAANGDTAADDGIYSGIFTQTSKEGHYQFTFVVKGTSATNGDFQRFRSVERFVRPKPAPANTSFAAVSSAVQPNGNVIVRLRATPRDPFNSFIGPDYLDHLKISSSEGVVETPLEDKLDGAYETSYRLPSAASNPTFGLEVMGTTVVTKTLSELQSKFPRWLLWLLILLVLILIIIWLLFFRKK